MDAETDTAAAKPTPLTGWWIAAVVVIGVMAAALAVGGMILSFRAVSAEMAGPFGHWAWLVPIVTDLAVLVFSGVDLLLNRLSMGHWLARVVVYGATIATIAMNYSAGDSQAGRVAHIMMPSIWVAFIELMRHVVRRLTGLADGTLREPVPAARWILAPWRTAKLWRRMVLWQTNSYPKALAQERRRLEAIALLQEEHGPLWRWRVGPLVRLRLSLGESVRATGQAHSDADQDDAHADESRIEASVRNEESATHNGPEAATQRTDPKPATRTGRTARTTAPKVTRLTPHTERTRIIHGLIAQHGADGVTPKVVAEALGIDRSNGYRALQRFLKENPPRPEKSPEAASEDDPERAWAAS